MSGSMLEIQDNSEVRAQGNLDSDTSVSQIYKRETQSRSHICFKQTH